MTKKKILVFTDWFYPGYKAGGPIQSVYNLINTLKEYYEFSVVTRNTDYMSSIPYPDVKSDTWNNMPNGMRIYYFSKKHLHVWNIASILKTEKYDIAYLNSMYSLAFTLLPLIFLRAWGREIILAPRGMLGHGSLSLKGWKKKPFLTLLKHYGFTYNVIFHATSLYEANDITLRFGKDVTIRIASNLPDQLTIPSETGTTQLSAFVKTKISGELHLVSIARIAPEKHLHYALKILSNIKGKVKLDIYGPVYNELYWAKCVELIGKMPGNIIVGYSGAIRKEDIPVALNSAHFLFLPTKGENFGHIILESMMYGCPVIISDRTLWTNLEQAKSGFDIQLYNIEKFIQVIERCINMDAEEYGKWRKGARDFAEKFITNPNLIEQNIQLFN